MLKSYTDKKDYLKDLNNKIKRKFYIKKKGTSYATFSVNSFCLLLTTISLLIYIIIIYAAYFSKCYKKFKNQANINNPRYFSDFEFQTNQTNYLIRIPFCSCFYRDGFYLREIFYLSQNYHIQTKNSVLTIFGVVYINIFCMCV